MANPKSEILFYYESKQNPNGDPDAENQPRMLSDETIMVTDVRIKRTIRDYAKKKFGYTIFVDMAENGDVVTAEKRAKEICKDIDISSKEPNYILPLLEKTFDVPLFGALVPIKKISSNKITGPIQFGIGRSVNKVRLIQPAITSRFSSDESKKSGTMGRYHSVEFALIKIFGGINPNNIEQYFDKSSVIKTNFDKYVKELPIILWDGTNNLVTRSKFPQRSILYIQVDYKDTIYNDLPYLVSEKIIDVDNGKPNIYPKSLSEIEFEFSNLINKLSERKDNVLDVKIKHADDVKIQDFVKDLKNKGINVTIL